MSIATAIKIISQEIELREEFERRRAIRMGLDPSKVLNDAAKPVSEPVDGRVKIGSG